MARKASKSKTQVGDVSVTTEVVVAEVVDTGDIHPTVAETIFQSTCKKCLGLGKVLDSGYFQDCSDCNNTGKVQ